MKRGLLLAPVVLLLVIPGLARAENKREFPLKYRLSVNVSDEVATATQQLTLLADRVKLNSEPTYHSPKPIYSTMLVGAQQDELGIVLDTSSENGRDYDCLYVDGNGDGRLSADEKLKGIQRETAWTFGPTKMMVHSGTKKVPQWFLFQFADYEIDTDKTVRSLHALNSGYYTGTVHFGQQKRLIAVVDNNGNGLYNDLTKTGKLGDRLLIDFNGDGEFDIRPTSEETQPLGRYVLVADQYWQVDVAADGSSVAVQPLAKALGTLQSDISEFALLLRDEEGDLRVRGSGGIAKVPTGDYTLVRCQFVLNDQAGRRWVFTGGGESRVTVKVPANESARLLLGPPLTPKIEVTRIDNEKIALTLSLHGAGGETYNEVYYNDNAKPPVPKARLFDSNGRELAQLDFHYG